MKTCPNCKHYQHGEWEEKSHSCAIGLNIQLEQWWNNNGRKIYGRDIIDEMPCFEYTEGSLKLQNIMSKLDELNDILNGNNK